MPLLPSKFASFSIAIALGLTGVGCAHHGGEAGNCPAKHAMDDDKGEESVAVDKLPAAVVAGVKNAMPGGTITEADKETEGGKVVYELDVKSGAKVYELHVSEDGKVLKTEEDKD